jgi:hypothetical protein
MSLSLKFVLEILLNIGNQTIQIYLSIHNLSQFVSTITRFDAAVSIVFSKNA